MSAAYWVYAGFYASAALVTISQVGKPREPLRGSSAAIAVAIVAGLIYLLVHAARTLP